MIKYEKRYWKYLLNILTGKGTLRENEEKIVNIVHKMIKYQVKHQKGK